MSAAFRIQGADGADGDALDLDELERIARAATPGPWEARPPHGWPVRDDGWDEFLIFHGPDTSDTITPGGGEHGDYGLTAEDAAHIATFDPQAVLALIERVRVAEAERDTAVLQRDEIKAERNKVRSSRAELATERDEALATVERVRAVYGDRFTGPISGTVMEWVPADELRAALDGGRA